MPQNNSAYPEWMHARRCCTGEWLREISGDYHRGWGRFPAAATPQQKRLEAGLLLAIGNAEKWFPIFRNNADDPAAVIEMVRPFPGRITLKISDGALEGFLAAALPSLWHEGLSGVPGLRPEPSGNHLDLRVLGTCPVASVRLRGVTRKRWNEVQEYLGDHQDPDVRIWRDGRRRWHPAEIAASQAKPDLRDGVMSALLRRYALWKDADWSDVRTNTDDLQVRWSGGSSSADVATVLTHPACRIPGVEPIPQRLADGERIVFARSATAAGKRERQRMVADRAAYLGEDVDIAERGITPADPGIDGCSGPQRELRALLALHVFNKGPHAAPPGWRDVHTVTAYSMTVSPRADELVIHTNASDNLTNWLLRTSEDFGLPGLRLECRPTGSTFRLIHVPTGGRMTITSADEPPRCTATRHDHGWRTDHWPATTVPLQQDERVALASLPPRTPDMTMLLAGVIVRLEARDPAGTWAIGSWWHDPLGRTPWLGRPGNRNRKLWGSHDHWTLEWNAYPYEEDLIQALTDPVCGIAGCRMKRSVDHTELRYGTAVLRLVHLPSALHRRLEGSRAA
ncbi:hypothetical protein NQK81_02465 [Amycolatopsis roodepoortensis]|uniref:hypothetical protein n=1 Tax=Amycolatopsis roodepoortensis TaxID=700274 RepID=UPI00214C756B|nr:hypothetical protein [Amycolatopsis roodepoortensis]UUV32337.1 hypothetical protein NQK81_02465 [Amycolatopsis roodepoortensis]